MLPIVGLLAGLQNGGDAVVGAVVVGQVGIQFFGDCVVVEGVGHLVRVGIAHFNSAVDPVLKHVLRFGSKVVERQPEVLAVGSLVHQVGRIQLPIIEIAHRVNELLLRSQQHQRRGCLVGRVVVDARHNALGQFGHVGGGANGHLQFADVLDGFAVDHRHHFHREIGGLAHRIIVANGGRIGGRGYRRVTGSLIDQQLQRAGLRRSFGPQQQRFVAQGKD